jgi:hypothetical protein
MVERALGTHAILGIYRVRSLPGGGIFGTLVNGNHAASVLSLGALIAAGFAVERGGAQRALFSVAAALSAFGVLSTASRAGAAGLAAGVAFLASYLFVIRFGRVRGAIATAVVLLLVTSSALWLSDGLRTRLEASAPDQIMLGEKVRGWRVGAATTAAFGWTGVGRGAFEGPASAYRPKDEWTRLVFPENLLLQMTSEWGVPIALAIIALAIMGATPAMRALRRVEPPVIGAAAGVAAVLVHELADFGLELPGVAIPTLVAAGVVIARGEKRVEHPRFRVPWPVWTATLVAWPLILAGAAWAADRTLDEDVKRVEAATKTDIAGNPTEVRATYEAAIARHPADYTLQLLAARYEIRTNRGADGARAAMHHLNRALALYPASGVAHRLAAYLLATTGHHEQAAIEYRLATQYGTTLDYDELIRVVKEAAIDGVPQEPKALIELAHHWVTARNPSQADIAARRAVELAGASEWALVARVEVAQDTRSAPLISAASAALLASASSPESFATAARALALIRDASGSDDAILRGLKSNADDAALLLLGTQLRLDRGNLTGARSLLQRQGANFSLADRQRAEELRAELAERSGEPEEAVAARARARLIAASRKDTDYGPSGYTPRQ